LGAAIEQNQDFSVTIWHNGWIRQIKNRAWWHNQKSKWEGRRVGVPEFTFRKLSPVTRRPSHQILLATFLWTTRLARSKVEFVKSKIAA
jgi:hypothetical protein